MDRAAYAEYSRSPVDMVIRGGHLSVTQLHAAGEIGVGRLHHIGRQIRGVSGSRVRSPGGLEMMASRERSRIEFMFTASGIPSAHVSRYAEWRLSAVRPAAVSIAFALITIFGLSLHLSATAMVPLYLLIVVLQSLAGGAKTAAILTSVAGTSLAYLFFPPRFSIRIGDPLNQVALFTFLLAAYVITWVVSNARKTFGDNQKRDAPAEGAANFGDRERQRPPTAITNQLVTCPDTLKAQDSVSGSPIQDDIVYQQVSRIIESRAFKKSIRLRRLLEFIVDATIRGEAASLKEWVIGTDVYCRGKDFDPRLDPIVRTEIRRLRRKLREYFETEGREDAFVIVIPKGSYIPCFRERCDDDVAKLAG